MSQKNGAMECTSSNTLLSLIVGLIQKSSDKKHTIWIKCDKGYFGLKEDLYLAAAYFPNKTVFVLIR